MRITVKTHPNSKRNSINRLSDGSFDIYTTASPQENKANQAVVHQLSEFLKCPVSFISIYKGHHSRTKIVNVDSEK